MALPITTFGTEEAQWGVEGHAVDDPTPSITLPGCPSAKPTLSAPRVDCFVPDYHTWMYDVSCESAGCLFPVEMWFDARDKLRRFLGNAPGTGASSAAKRVWTEWVAEYVGRAVFASNIRLRSNAQAEAYLGRFINGGWLTQGQVDGYKAKLRGIPETFPETRAWLAGWEKAAAKTFPTETGYVNEGVVTANEHFDWTVDPEAMSTFFAQKGTFLQVLVEDTRARPSSAGAKTKRFFKKLSPVRPAPAGKAPRYKRHFVLSADATVRYLTVAARELLKADYEAVVLNGIRRWLVCFEAGYNAGFVNVTPEQLRAMRTELARIEGAKIQGSANTMAAAVKKVPEYGRVAAKLIQWWGKIAGKHAASGQRGVPCPPPPFMRSSTRADCDTTQTVGADASQKTLDTVYSVAKLFGEPPPKEQTPSLAPYLWGAGGIAVGLLLVRYFKR